MKSTGLFAHMRNILVDRYTEAMIPEIEATLFSLFSGESMIVVGPPGTAKTSLLQDMSSMISNANFFHICLSPYTEPDELLGPVDIKAYREEGVLRRVMDGYLPTAHIAFFDEVFRSSSAVRSLLLDVMMYRRIRDGGRFIQVPLLSLFSASNSVSLEEDDRAFYDRLIIRVFQRQRELEDVLVRIIDAGIRLETEKLEPVADIETVKRMQREVIKEMQGFSADARRSLAHLVVLAREEGLQISRRRAVKTLKVASAIKVSRKGDEITSIMEAASLTFPETEEDLPRIQKCLSEIVPPREREIMQAIRTMDAEASKFLQRIEAYREGRLGETERTELLRQAKEFGTQVYERAKKMSDETTYPPSVSALLDLVEKINRIMRFVEGESGKQPRKRAQRG